MHDARSLILKAIEQAAEILPAGKHSLLAIAARALDPKAPLTREGLARTLGLHPSLAVAILVTADLAGDTLSRREIGLSLFGELPLRGRMPLLTPAGQLAVTTFTLERLAPLREQLAGLLEEVLPLAQEAREGQTPSLERLEALEKRAQELQRTKVVMVERGSKSKAGIPTDEAIRRRATQAVRALLRALADGCRNPHLCPTVAGESAAALIHAQGIEAGTRFCVELGAFLDELPPDQAPRPPGNGS